MHTTLCDVLGIEAPIIGAPFGPWDSVELAAAICAAGGLGSLGTAVRPVPDLQRQWARLRELTDRPFAINHVTRPFDESAFAATLAARPAAISFHLGDPGDLVARAHDAGIRWIQQVMDVEQARQAVRRRVDVIVAQGGEAGGHSGFIGTMVLVPQVVDVAGDIPVAAAGGIADGRGLAAALALGAQGVAMGTRFLATPEMRISPAWKRMIVEADAGDAVQAEELEVLLPPYNRPHYPALGRVLRTPFLDEWSGRPAELADRAAELAPVLVREVLGGGGHEYVPFAGQSVGLIHEVRPAGDIVRETVRDATPRAVRA
ncbi:NAD(P)H-dependent flavin oxidoreductase [Actinoplanes sp. CA-142083]|uniref:NAD(P)H-dependent flavin oxidoreductase n=1 Tax=Actinoplanes sp. CA-142083 TaxID=3239903 RepID=UPI003D94D73C